jgi:hypothetical protein
MTTMEVEKTYASKGLAGTALGTGIGGLALSLLNGGAGNLLGGLMNTNGCVCSENMPVNRYELAQEQKIANLESQIALRDANTYSDQKLLELYKYVDGEFRSVRGELCDQKVLNATTGATISCLSGQVNCMQALLNSITKTVVPNSAICPGWGDVTVSITPATTAAAGA